MDLVRPIDGVDWKCKSNKLGVLLERTQWIQFLPVSTKDPIPQHNVLAEINIGDAMMEIMALGFIQIDPAEEWNFDIISLVVEAGCGICSKHD